MSDLKFKTLMLYKDHAWMEQWEFCKNSGFGSLQEFRT